MQSSFLASQIERDQKHLESILVLLSSTLPSQYYALILVLLSSSVVLGWEHSTRMGSKCFLSLSSHKSKDHTHLSFQTKHHCIQYNYSCHQEQILNYNLFIFDRQKYKQIKTRQEYIEKAKEATNTHKDIDMPWDQGKVEENQRSVGNSEQHCMHE